MELLPSEGSMQGSSVGRESGKGKELEKGLNVQSFTGPVSRDRRLAGKIQS